MSNIYFLVREVESNYAPVCLARAWRQSLPISLGDVLMLHKGLYSKRKKLFIS